jgi:hypothetical protein
MQAYKLKGKIDSAGNLVIAEPVNMPPGDVEMVIWQVVEVTANGILSENESLKVTHKREVECSIPILKDWLENTDPVPSDFDPDQAKWEYLKEKHNL